MRYLALFEFCSEDVHKVNERYQKYMVDMEKTPEKYPKIIFPHHSTIDKYGGFVVVEGTSRQLLNNTEYFRSLMKFKYVQVIESSKAVESTLKT